MGVTGNLNNLIIQLQKVSRVLEHPTPILNALGNRWRIQISTHVPRETGRAYSALILPNPQVKEDALGGVVSIGDPNRLGKPEDQPPRGLIAEFLIRWRAQNREDRDRSRKEKLARIEEAKRKRLQAPVRTRTEEALVKRGRGRPRKYPERIRKVTRVKGVEPAKTYMADTEALLERRYRAQKIKEERHKFIVESLVTKRARLERGDITTLEALQLYEEIRGIRKLITGRESTVSVSGRGPSVEKVEQAGKKKTFTPKPKAAPDVEIKKPTVAVKAPASQEQLKQAYRTLKANRQLHSISVAIGVAEKRMEQALDLAAHYRLQRGTEAAQLLQKAEMVVVRQRKEISDLERKYSLLTQKTMIEQGISDKSAVEALQQLLRMKRHED